MLIRPGALGDVLAVRGVIRLLKDTFPKASLALAAPGERGRFLCRPGWADQAHDWESGAFSWLFSPGGTPPPPALEKVFAGCGWALAYVATGADAGFPARLAELAPGAGILLAPPRPAGGSREKIGARLLRPVLDYCRDAGWLPADFSADLAGLAAARLKLAGPASGAGKSSLPYAVLHPGSGSGKKNWPLANYAALGRRLAAAADPAGRRFFPRLIVTSGEADGDLGQRLAAMLPGAVLAHSPALEELAALLAGAALYVGNDSGVSHLAAAVEDAAGRTPEKLVVFGASDPGIWAPPGARVMSAGPDMSGLSPETVWTALAGKRPADPSEPLGTGRPLRTL
ncbi:MAG: hypothetical protein LBU23_11685 [Planctomycetota bacterium]|nr:hypothetical protein [Planctomycetota bacterium]